MKSVLTLVFSFVVIMANAQSKDSSQTKYKSKVYLYAGSFFPTINTTMRINSEKVGLGTQLGLEDNLKMDDQKTTLRFDGYWDISKRSGVAASFFYLNRSSTLVLDDDIQFRDSTYHVGQTINIRFNTSFFSASYRYHFFSHENWNAGASVGINWLQIGTGITLEGNKNYEYSVSLPAPTPFLGVHMQGKLSERLHARYDLTYFGLTIQGISGRVIDNKIMMEYYIFKNLGLGAAFNMVNYTINEIPFRHDFDGNIRFTVTGFNLYVAGKF